MKKFMYAALILTLVAGLSVTATAQGKGKGKKHAKSTTAETMRQSHGKSATHSHAGTAAATPERSNNGGEVRGQERADEVQDMNTAKKSTHTSGKSATRRPTATTTTTSGTSHGRSKKK